MEIQEKKMTIVSYDQDYKKLPVLFLITGDLTKKAEQMLKDKFRNITVNKI